MEMTKLVVVGDSAVGKTCLLLAYTTNRFPEGSEPTIFDNYSTHVIVDGEHISMGLWDTAGQEDYDRFRPLSYIHTDVFLICFSVGDPASLSNIREKWIPEIQHHGPDVPKVIVACKTDLRSSESSSPRRRCTTYKEGKRMAKAVGATYVETSARTATGLTQCFETAIRLSFSPPASKSKSSFFQRSKKSKPLPIPPAMPPPGQAPTMEIEISTFAEDWYKALQDPKFHDVTFLVEGTRRLHAHKIILCSASKFLCRIFASSFTPQYSSQLHELNEIDGFSREDLNSGKIEGICAVYEMGSAFGQETAIELSADIRAKTFVRVLEFLYTGDPKLAGDTEEKEIEDLRKISVTFDLPYLTTMCENIVILEGSLYSSIRPLLNYGTRAKMKQLFFNQETLADVVFVVAGRRIFVHKVVLSTRSEVMAAMFGGSFMEGGLKDRVTEVQIPNTTPENFLAMLEYLYTDHVPLEESNDVMGILALADENCQPRLVNMCELYISEEIDRVCQNRVDKSEIDVIGVLNTAHLLNAKQLVTFCLRFISNNYPSFANRKEFSQLTEDDRKHVDEHRWPPLRYLQKVEEYEKKMAMEGGKCVVL